MLSYQVKEMLEYMRRTAEALENISERLTDVEMDQERAADELRRLTNVFGVAVNENAGCIMIKEGNND